LPADQQQQTTDDTDNTTTGDQQDSTLKDCHPAIRILKERTRNKQREFYVLFEDRTKHWCHFVTPRLLEHYRILQDKRRRRARNRKKNA